MSGWQYLQRSAMDLFSAAAFLGVWLFRDQLDYDTLRSLLLWPVVFSALVAGSLVVAGMLDTMRSGVVRTIWFAFVAAFCLGLAFLLVERAGMPYSWTIALWLLAARLVPPTGMRFGHREHRAWVFVGAGYSGMLWGAGFVATLLLMLVFSTDAGLNAAGERVADSPAWIFPLVWTPYFVAEGVLRARRTAMAEARRASNAPRRA